MFHQRHLGDEIGGGDELRLGVTPGDHNMQPRPARSQRRDHGTQVKILVAQRDIEFIKDHQRKARIGHQFARLRPCALGRRDIARAILRLPGKPLAHRVPSELIAEFFQRVALGRVPGALDELHHTDAIAAPKHAQRQSKSRGRFSLAGAGVHDEQAFLDGLARDFGVLHGLAVGHLGAMPLAAFVFLCFAHGVSFRSPSAQAASPRP